MEPLQISETPAIKECAAVIAHIRAITSFDQINARDRKRLQ